MKTAIAVLVLAVLTILPRTSSAFVITFEGDISLWDNIAVYDENSDGRADARFQSSSVGELTSTGPGPYSMYIAEPGLGGIWPLSHVDLIVDFLKPAYQYLKFGFAQNNDGPLDWANWVRFTVYDGDGNQLATSKTYGKITYPDGIHPVMYPENEVYLPFSGAASYATFDFGCGYDRGAYIIDNFEGSFEPASAVVPEPSSLLLLAAGLMGVGWARKRMAK